jgi:hypothetical protein
MAAVWSASTGADSKLPLSKFPISTAIQEALDSIRIELLAGAPINALGLLDEDEIAEVRNSTGAGGRDLAPKLQAALDARYLLTGTDQSGAGGHGACMELDAGTWTISTLQLRPGMAVRGLVDRFEVRVKQTSGSLAPLIDILGRGQNQDVISRRTSVILQRLDLAANGNLDANGDPINGINLRVDPDNEGDDDSANRTGLIMEEVQVGGASGWGLYNLKRGKMWFSKCQFSGNGLAPLLPNNKVGGLFSQGPDSFFHKCYCGNNGGVQLHIKSSATPSVVEIEMGSSKQATIYPTFWSENNTDLMFGGGGNCTGWILLEGQEDDITANEYDTECSINLFDFTITLKDKSFKDGSGNFGTLPGFITAKNIRGWNINNVRFDPATDDDIAAHHYTHRPTQIVYIQGARTRGKLTGPLPPLADWKWPAGTPEVWPGSAPTNTYDSITNKPDQLLIQTSDPTDTTHAHLFDRLKFFAGGGIVGMTTGANPPTGCVGELIQTDVTSAAPVALTDNTIASIGNIVLTAGEWDIRATLIVQGTGATATLAEAAVSTANNTVPATTAQRYSVITLGTTTVTNPLCTLKMGPFQLKLAAGSTRYLNAKARFSAGTVNAYGVIEARRIA